MTAHRTCSRRLSKPPDYGVMVRVFMLNSDTARSIHSYDVFVDFPQIKIGLLGSWSIEVAHIRIRLDLSLSICRGNGGRPLIWVYDGSIFILIEHEQSNKQESRKNSPNAKVICIKTSTDKPRVERIIKITNMELNIQESKCFWSFLIKLCFLMWHCLLKS